MSTHNAQCVCGMLACTTCYPAHDEVRPTMTPDPAETFHPMEYVLDELEARGISPDMAGRMLERMVNLSLLEWMEFIAGGPVTRKLAIGLSQLFGTSAEVWEKLQRAYDQRT